LLKFIELHADISSEDLSPEEEFSLLFHVLEVVPALKSTAQDLLTKLCSESDDEGRSTVFGAAIKGVLLSQTSSRLAALSAMNNASEDLFKASVDGHARSLAWIACNDLDEDIAKTGRSIWDRSGCVTSAAMIDHIVKYCSCDAVEVRKSSCKALGALVSSLREGEPSIVGQTLVRVTSDLYSTGTTLSRRLGAAECLIELGSNLDGDIVFSCLEFLLAHGFLDPDPEVRSSMMAAGVAVIGGAGSEQAESILPIMEKYLENPKDRGLSEEQYDHVRLGAVVCIGATAQHMDPSNPKVLSIVNTLLEVLMTPSEVVQRSVSDRLPPLIKSLMAINKPFIEETVSNLLQTCLEGEKYGDRRGAAYGLSGCVKGLGLSSLKSFGIMEALKGGVENKKDANAREGALLAFECLSSKLGRLFEPYVIQILPMLLSSLGDGKVEVREAADTASRVIMSQLTAQGVKLVLPSLLGGAEEKQWRAKQGSIQLLGSMAYCAPKQLGSCLPQIVPVLGEALADPHPKVSAAARDAMDEVGAVIKNPEVAKLVPTLMAALADPNKHNKKALDTLLSTIFVNTVDSASLALIIPVVHRGLRDRSGDVKKRAARIVGNLCTLMNDPKDMSPYLPTLMPELQGALVDPLPEVRGAAAKALGALTKGMSGLQASSAVDISPWLLDTMRSEGSSVERSGAAQGLAEIISVKGAGYLDQVLPEVFAGCDSKSAATREGSITLFKYLPHCMTEDFQNILPDVLPRVLGGLADESEGVREASFAAGSVAVDLYAKTSLPLVLPAVEAGAADGNWRIRQSSIELLGDLLFKVAGTSGRIQQDLNDEESEGISVESHGQAIIEVLGLERRNDVLARLYLARADVAYTVRTAALHVWKTIVTNTPKTLIEILPVLMSRVIAGLSHNSEDQRNSSGQCLGELVKKLGDRVLPRIVPILMQGAHSDDPLTRVGVLNGMREVASNASRTQLTEFMADILTEIQRLLCDEDEEVRQSAGGALEVIFKTGGGSAAESVIPSLLNGLHGDDERVAKSLEGLRVVLSVRPQLLGIMVPRLVEPPLSKTDVVALGALSEVSGEAIHNYLSKILPPLFRIMHDEEDVQEAATKALLGVVMAVKEDGLHLLVQQINRGFDTPESSYGACVCLRLFCKNTDMDFQEQIGGMLATVVPLLANPSSDRTVKAAWDALAAMTDRIPKEMAPSYVRPMKDAFTSARERMIRRGAEPSTCLPGLLLPKALSPFLTTYLQGILQGSSAELRELAAEAIGELVQLTDEATLKPFVIQITGPLIRIVGDKFPPHTKTAILRTMGILVDKAGLALRPFIPQLQTTFVKCLPDPAREVRLQGARNLGSLSKMAPRLDQLVADLSSSCMSADIDGPKEAYIAALAAILHQSGEKLKEETMERVAEAIVASATEAIDTDSEAVVKHAAVALGEYSQHCSESELDRLMNHGGFGPLVTPGTGLGSRMCTAIYTSLVAPLASGKLKGWLVPFVDGIIKLSHDNSVDVRMTASVAAGRTVLSEESTLPKLMSTFLALLGPDQHVECQKQTMAILRAIADASPEALVPHFVSLIPTLISSTKTTTGATKLAAERTLACVLRLSTGDEGVVKHYLEQRDVGAVAKATLSEAYTRRLVRICDGATDDLADYAI
jgi:HEAT repeat protein